MFHYQIITAFDFSKLQYTALTSFSMI
uniref:Uncharacterized protein n=1 Tax=Arundo donax TaxID=35708 RepID=A0A0A9ADH0_ARUDO